jgi:hypothetical protein
LKTRQNGEIGISGLFGLAENHILALDKGIVQRILYLVGLAWLVYEERLLAKGYFVTVRR